MHVAALHDRNERGGLPRFQLVVADRFRRAGFFVRIANRKARIIHPPRSLFLEQFGDVVRYAMKFLRADHQVEVRHRGEKRISAGLGHATEKTEDCFRPTLCDLPEHAHFSQGLLLCHIAHATGVQQHHVGIGFTSYALVAALQQRMRDLFRVALVHLAAVGLDEKFGHRESGILPQSAPARQRHRERAAAGACARFAVSI